MKDGFLSVSFNNDNDNVYLRLHDTNITRKKLISIESNKEILLNVIYTVKLNLYIKIVRFRIDF